MEDVAEEFAGHASVAGNPRLHPRGRQAFAVHAQERRRELKPPMDGPMKRIGIIAGAGSLPLEVARSVVDRGGAVHIIMVDGADAALETFPHTAVNWAQLGRATAALKRAGIRDILVLGGGARPSFRNARPDFTFFRELPRVVRLLKAGGDDAVLRGLLGVFERQGFTIVGVDEVAPELLVGEAQPDEGRALGGKCRRHRARLRSRRSPRTATTSGRRSSCSRGRIEAIEGAEGTDRMLKRVAEARRRARRQRTLRRSRQAPQARPGSARRSAGHRPEHGRQAPKPPGLAASPSWPITCSPPTAPR